MATHMTIFFLIPKALAKVCFEHSHQLRKNTFVLGGTVLKVVKDLLTCVDQMFSALSIDPEAKYLPSGLNAIE